MERWSDSNQVFWDTNKNILKNWWLQVIVIKIFDNTKKYNEKMFDKNGNK